MPDDQIELSDSAWRRGWTDTKGDLADWRFWLAEVVGGGLLGLYYENALPGLAFVLGFALFLWTWATASAPIRQRNEAREFLRALRSTPPLSILFPPEANSPEIISPFRQVTTFRLSGAPLAPPHPCQYEFYLGVTNNTLRTIKNVGLQVVSADKPERPIGLHLLAKKNHSLEVDIVPKLMELFRLGAVIRREEGKIIGNTKPVDAPTLASVVALAQKHTKLVIGLIMPHSKGHEPLLRNDGQSLKLIAYGEDVDPSVAEVTLNMKNEVSVLVRPI